MRNHVSRREFLTASFASSGMVLGLASARPTQAQGQAQLPSEDRPADEVGKPYVVYYDKVNDFTPGGYMPDGKGVAVNPNCRDRPKQGQKCIQISYRLEDNLWVGVAFLLDNQYEPKRQFNLYEALGARKGDPIVLRFHARSADGTTAKFKVAGMPQDASRFGVETTWKSFNNEWSPVEIDVSNADLSSLHGALTVVLDREQNAALKRPEIQIDLDQIYFTRIRGLRLMSSVKDASDIPTEGKDLIIVATVDNVLHFRMFDGHGRAAVDTDEKRLTEQGRQIEDLRKQLVSLWPPHELTGSEKGQVITAVTSIVGHTRRQDPAR
jgi:hypothetical protein